MSVYALTPAHPAKELLVTPQKKVSAATSDKVEQYEKLLKTIPEIQRKGAANPYTALNGNMFTLLLQSKSLALRLPKGEREEFLKIQDQAV